MDIFLHKRQEQLNLQSKIDKRLKKYSNQCPQKVIQLLLLERKINRDFTNKLNTLNPITIYNIISENLRFYDDFYKKIAKFKC